ncbi:MAG: S-methyl-5'-thioadenosine phosphorylase [Pseudomonadota bacterium]|nr:MAG: S-methyl-5'-thioadenosine phosphorylase [Pseudomonadota bacterium]
MKVGIIGGSGLYNLKELEKVEKVQLDTPFGKPSSDFLTGEVHNIPVIFIPRHGLGHVLLPTEIPFRANIWGLKKLGVTHLILVGAVGSLKEEIIPGHMVFPDQFIDLTRHRISTFFGNGVVAHVQFGDPVCSKLSEKMVNAANAVGATIHLGGTYICMEGPAFSSRAESMLYRSWSADVIGMTNAQEAKLAREAEIAFASIALATDYDCWHISESEVNVEDIIKVMHENVETARRIIVETLRNLPPDFPNSQQDALKFALITEKSKIPQKTRSDLDLLLSKYLD